MGCIYSILNKVNGKIYVGQTNRKFSRRMTEHKSHLRGNCHRNPHLQNAWNKYGEDAFEFNILEECPNSKLDDNEEWWITHFKSNNPAIGYNMQGGGNSQGTCSPDFREKMSKVTKGENNGNWGKGVIDEWGGFWFIEHMAKTGISITTLEEWTGIRCADICSYLKRRGTSWSELSVTVTERPDNKLERYGGVDFLKDCAKKGMSQKKICDEYGLGTENVIYRYLKKRDYTWAKLKDEVRNNGQVSLV